MTGHNKLDNVPAIETDLLVHRNITNRETNMSYAKKLGLAVAVTAFSVAMVTGPADAKRVKWKLHSAWGAAVPHLGTSGVRWAKNIGRMSDGKFTVKFFLKNQKWIKY